MTPDPSYSDSEADSRSVDWLSTTAELHLIVEEHLDLLQLGKIS